MKRKIISILFAAVLLLTLGIVTAAPVAAATTIDRAAITGITVPATGNTPDISITTNTQYTATITWSPADSPFAGSKVYTATIILTPIGAYTLSGVTEDFFTVNGATATNSADSGVVTAVYPATGSVEINIAAIPGVTVPVAGATPVTAITATSEYTGTVAWSGTPSTFAANTVYTATITLTPIAPYTLTGVNSNYFTVAGASSHANSADSGVVTAVFPHTAITISTGAIAGVTPPVAGATPVTTVTAGTGYTGTVTWSPNDSKFAGITVYTATITLTPTTGCTLYGVGQDSFTVAGATATNAANSGVVTAVFPATGNRTIDIAAIAGVTAPVTGGTPVTAITATSEYTGSITWSPADSTFKSNTVYTATIILSPTTGNTLTGVVQNYFTVAGASATNAASSGVITALFPATATTISGAAIAGVTAPVAGATPVTTVTAGTGYTGTVAWSGTPSTFAGGTIYTATITLTPTTGYTLTGVAANYFTVAGATATNSANSGVVTAVFPITGQLVINIAAISGVTVPVAGATPVTAITATSEYTGTVTWSPADSTFAPNQIYTATIILSPTPGNTLTGVVQNFFTVNGATATNAASSGVVTAAFPATGDKTIDIAAIAGVTAPVAGATPVTAITETSEYTGSVTWSPADSTFAANTVYWATITLTPKTNYTLTGVAVNFFTVAGTSTHATNLANTGVITAAFPVTATTITGAAIAGVTAPVTGATPVTTVTAGTGYTGTVAWSGTPSTFAGGTIYTATITLTPTTGYTLYGVTTNFFTVAGATATNSANAGVVTAIFPATPTLTIDIAAITGVTPPVAGATRTSSSTITQTSEFTGTVSWSGSGSTYAANTVYTATITLTAKTGYTLTGVTANFFTVAGATATNSADSGVITAVFPHTAITISTGAIAGVTVPVAGATPVTTVTAGTGYTGTVTWSPDDSTFAGVTVYTATITLTPTTGYTLYGVGHDSFTVAGTSTHATNSSNTGVVTAVFPATGSVAINIAAIAGVTAPVAGATPVTAITATSEYTGTVAWSPAVATTFAPNQIYTATIILTPTTGNTLTGVGQNYFTVAGATATNAASSGVVNAVFPVTAPANSIALGTGWNLVSSPLIPTNTAIGTVLSGISAHVQIVYSYQYNASGIGGWLYWIPGNSSSTLTTMTDGNAYWIDMTAPSTLTFTGTSAPVPPAMPSSYDVAVGWNMIGYRSTTSEAASVYLAGVTGFVRLYSYNNVTGYATVALTDSMNPSQGYWLAVTAAGTIYP